MAEFGYTAETQSESREKVERDKVDPHDVKMMKRALKNVKLPTDAWKQLRQDLENGAGKDTICNKYGIKRSYFKHLKRVITST